MRPVFAPLVCIFMSLIASAQGPIGISRKTAYPNLQRILELSDTQWTRLSENLTTYHNYIAEKYQRLSQVNEELLFEKTRPEPDPSALGIRLYEIAAICQQSTARLDNYKQDLRKLLTPSQSARLLQLEENLNLLPPIAEAQDLDLLGGESKNALPSGFQIPGQPLSWRVTRVYGVPPQPGCPASGFLGTVGRFGGVFNIAALYPNLLRHLELTSDQLQQILTVNGRLDQDLSEARVAAEVLRRELQVESALPAPNPSLLGEKAVRLEQICRLSIALVSGVEQTLPKLLTESQQSKWAELERALQLLPALIESQNLRLNSRVPTDALPPFFFNNSTTRRLEWSGSTSNGPNLPGCEPNSSGFRWFDTATFFAPGTANPN